MSHQTGLRFEQIDGSRCALVAINFQVRSLPAVEDDLRRKVTSKTGLLCQVVRRAGGMVVWLRHTMTDAGEKAAPRWLRDQTPRYDELLAQLSEGAPGHDVAGHADRDETDIVLDKYQFSAFIPGSSDLHETLRRRGVRALIIAGMATNICCESTARDAMMMGYKVMFASDATAAEKPEEHDASLLNLPHFADVRPTSAIVDLLGSGGGAGM